MWNDGAAHLDPVDVTLYGADPDVPLATQTVGPLEPGESAEILVSTTSDALGTSLVARVDAADEEYECAEADNTDEWTDLACP